MASNRINRINEEIQKALAELLRNVKDPRVSGTMISITRVETTPDLRFAKIYVSFLEENKAKDALKGLDSAAGYLRRELGAALQLRHTPSLQWAFDDSITYGAKMLKLINSLDTGENKED
ncbi:MAG: 30S ribosome-binding factor RbfA [Ruminococcaceae bacterium]|jgi:ribosome-binding factor A|nr:30S ribosome-binding factor RbfA [Oscillospiraceae bacterium]